jgi:P-type Mg2+ transporter
MTKLHKTKPNPSAAAKAAILAELKNIVGEMATLDTPELMTCLNSNTNGLDDDAVEESRKAHGDNAVTRREKPSLGKNCGFGCSAWVWLGFM